MNTAPLSSAEMATFRGLIVTRLPALLNTLNNEERVVLGAAVAVMLKSDAALTNAPANVATGSMTGATKAALFKLFDECRQAPASTAPTIMIAVVGVGLLVAIVATVYIVRRRQ